jgi:PmbA protein
MVGERVARAVLERVLTLSRADETEAVLTTSAEALTRFGHNTIHQNVVETDAELEVRAVVGRGVGSAATNDLSPAGVARVTAEAGELARHVPEDPEWPGLPNPAELPPAEHAPVTAFDDAAAGATPEDRARAVRDICAAARAAGLLASGAFGTGHGETAVLNSHGLFAYAPATAVDLTFVLEQPETRASAFAHATGWQLSQLDPARMTAEAVRRALADRNPRRAPAGEYPVLLEPYAVATLLEALAEAGMGALAVQEERSWMNGRLGLRCLSPSVTLLDDAFDPRGVPQAFDCEGVRKQRVPIVVQGTPISPVYDRQTAAREAGRASTGHAQPYDTDDWDGPLPENLSLAPGEYSLEELIGGLDRGLYVTRLWYVNLVSPHDCTVTGTTRDGVWWIEDGALAYPVENLRFDQSLVTALAGVRGLGRERRTVAGFFGGAHRVPAVALDSFRFVEA